MTETETTTTPGPAAETSSPAMPNRGKPFAVASVIALGVAVLPGLVYAAQVFFTVAQKGSSSQPALALFMAAIGVLIHGAAAVLGITGYALGCRKLGMVGAIGNGVVVLGILMLAVLMFAA